MGQRVNIILKVTDIDNNSKVTVYHDQWGIGRKGLLNIIALNHAVYNHPYGKPVTETVRLDTASSGTIKEYEILYEGGKPVTAMDFYGDGFDIEPFDKLENVSDPKSIGEFVDSHCDNNNGVVYIEVTDKMNPECRHIADMEIRYGFLLGHEDECSVYEDDGENVVRNAENEKFGPAFSRWLSLDEWCSLAINRNYADGEFKDICKSFFRYFGIEEIEN